jgi:hypothetical protein
MFGPGIADGTAGSSDTADAARGLVPRTLDYLWQHIAREKSRSRGRTVYTCTASFYEIYQERVYDLLDMCGSVNAAGLNVREDSKLGVYVDGAVEEPVNSSDDAARILTTGYRNRHVGATTMNRESSRSHAVFSLAIEVTVDEGVGAEDADADAAASSSPGPATPQPPPPPPSASAACATGVAGVKRTKKSRFSMIDLAGSERQKVQEGIRLCISALLVLVCVSCVRGCRKGPAPAPAPVPAFRCATHGHLSTRNPSRLSRSTLMHEVLDPLQ